VSTLTVVYVGSRTKWPGNNDRFDSGFSKTNKRVIKFGSASSKFGGKSSHGDHKFELVGLGGRVTCEIEKSG